MLNGFDPTSPDFNPHEELAIEIEGFLDACAMCEEDEVPCYLDEMLNAGNTFVAFLRLEGVRTRRQADMIQLENSYELSSYQTINVSPVDKPGD